jgi:hypothetical protein
MSDYIVKVNFNDGTHDYDLPYVFHITDPKEGIKATVIHGKRADGCIVIPAGKRSSTIRVRGNLVGDDYKEITDDMNTMKVNVTTDTATLTLKHKEGVSWITDWSYTVRRINEIVFPQSLRTGKQEYEITFIVIAY